MKKHLQTSPSSLLAILLLEITFFTLPAWAYTPPIGIPTPDFGIEQHNTDYSGKTYSAGGFIYRDAGNGPYTHYVDNSTACSDDNNTYGTKQSPRCTIPTNLPAGSVVELHGGPYGYLDLSNGITGTSQDPVYIRGYNDSVDSKISLTGSGNNKSTIKIENSSYLIIENIKADGSTLDGTEASSAFQIKSPSDHISIRNCEMTNYPMPNFCTSKACWYSSINSTGSSTTNAAYLTSNVVFYNNYIHDNADYPPSYETGRHGIIVESGSEYIWILDNRIERSGDDGVQVFHYAGGGHGPSAHHVYIGNNTVNNMGENAFDIKQSEDVIISQNLVHSFEQTQQLGAGSDGAAIVLNNDSPSDRLWVIYNEVYDSNIGIRTQSNGNVYIIGNLIHDIVRYKDAVIPTSPTGSTSGVAITEKSAKNVTIIHNTIDKVDGGIYLIAGADTFTISNNIVTNLKETESYTIAYNTGSLNIGKNLFYSANNNVGVKKIACPTCITGKDPLYLKSSVATSQYYNISSLNSPAAKASEPLTTPSAYDSFATLYDFLNIKYDYNQNPRPTTMQEWNLGAFQNKIPPLKNKGGSINN